MKKTFLLTAFLVVLFFIPTIVFANVIINEIAWMGTENSTSDEWIELYNTSSSSIDLTGYILEANDGSPLINLEGIILANEYFLLERTDDTSAPSVTADQIYTGALGNTGEYLKLKNDSNNIIDEINASEEWPAGDNTTKQTMERIGDDWQTSSDSGGTPKVQNSSGAVEESEENEEETPSSSPEGASEGTPGNQAPIVNAGDNVIGFIGQEISFDGSKSIDPEGSELAYSWNMGDGKLIEEKTFSYKYSYPGTYLVTLMVYDGRYYVSDTITVKIQSQEISINEFIPNPEGDDQENEWIEVYNDSDSIVDISGWQLDDEEEGSKPFVFPKNTLIAPKSYIVFPRPVTKIALNNDGDSVRLLLPEGIVFQEIQYDKAEQGRSSSNTPEGFVWSEPTPGMINISYPEAVGGLSRETAFQHQIEPETTKEPGPESSWRLTDIPDKEIKGGYLTRPNETGTTEGPEKQLAMIPPEAQVAQIIETEKETTSSETANLILMLAAVFLGALIIGIFITKFKRKKEAL